jgi:hypothetical protein
MSTFILAAIILIVGYTIYAFVYTSIDERVENRNENQVQKRGTMFGVFYRLDDTDDLFIVKRQTYKQAKKLSIQLGYNLHDWIFYCQNFEEITNLKTKIDNFYVKEIPKDENPKPQYTNKGINY